MQVSPDYLGVKLASGEDIVPISSGFKQFERLLGEPEFLNTFAQNLNVSVDQIKDMLREKKQSFQIRTLSVRHYSNLKQHQKYRWRLDQTKIFGWVDTRLASQDATIFINQSVRFNLIFSTTIKSNVKSLECLAFITLCHEFNHLLVRWLELKSPKQPFFVYNPKDSEKIYESGDAWECTNIGGRLGVTILESKHPLVDDIVYYEV